ncbi:SusC/RagA family TonB-linked outer membrane protein [Mucilaginibacter sp. E4BP6]|uniref:SusC/RagA family TonB-linked outer membrane protein n=1 Tax=Mucilaginibacter sp. E4BP6 TaxID=2723089 RepID=UPI0015C9E61A|nr:SusC/RagA family TonB-linked outer membrane protein [Mucilaginibacter sp. E4BP6]NYE68580.1 TonB-linked SusC/RagA family outer membrane protein [Mucilaginibacter sp. E4BP6]
MKKILPLFLLVPCLALGANSKHNNSSKAKFIASATSTRVTGGNKAVNQASFVLKGFVRDASGQALIGVTVSIKGTSTGTQTDANGKFAITVNTGDVLVFSYIGYIKKEIPITAPTELTIELDENSKELSEVVVTALGIKKERKSLGYSVSEVKGSELTTAKEPNFASELEGKVAGLNVTTVSGGPASSVNINIRGAASLSGGNQPLYIINGVQMVGSDNSSVTGISMNSGGEYDNSPDQGDGIGNINPDDIESISVLKGAAASALYGHNAKYGVILITTKSGSSKGTVEYNSNYEFEKAINPTDYQYEYGNGAEGLKPTSAAAAFSSGNASWGAKLDGSLVPQFDGVSRPYVAQTNNFDEFYRTGGAFTNTVSFSKAYDLAAIRLSASDLHDNSIVPNSGYDRKSFNFSGNFSPVKRLMIDAHLNYTSDAAQNRPILGDGPGNSSYQVLFLPTSLNVNTLNPGSSGTITAANLANGYTGIPSLASVGNELLFANNTYATNPWFAANKFINNSSRNRNIASASARYTFDDGLFAQVRIGQDYYTERFTDVVPNGTGYYAQANQNLAETYATVSELNTDFLIGKAFKATPDFTITPNVGGNIEKSRTESTTEAGVGFVIPYVYTVDNLASKTIAYNDLFQQVNSLYGTLELGYKSYLYLNGSVRSDWFSSLASSAEPNNKLNIIYPSVDGSFVFSELFKPSWMDFGKIRAGWANVGGGTSPYQTLLNYGLNSVQSSGMPLGLIKNSATPNASLQPSNAEELEIGTEIHTLQNRLNFDVTWYDKTSKNEIVQAPASVTSGYTGAVLNIGEIRNKGWEFLVSGTPVKEKEFSWITSLNAAYNANTVLALAAGQSSLPVAYSRTGYASTVDIVGKAADQVQAFDYVRNADGSIKVDPSTGIPVPGVLKAYGPAYGPWSAGFNNEFTYGHFDLTFLIDGKFGGKVFAGDEYYAFEDGLTKSTLPGRETGFANNTSTPTTAENYYTTLGSNVSGLFVQNASFIKFRQITFGYNIPTASLGLSKVIQSANLSVFGRNLFYIMKKTTDIDPEASYGTTSQGLELGGVPVTRVYGLSLDVKF